jgi:hypothetical protein
VSFLDTDHRWLPRLLQQQLWYLDAHPQCALVYSDAFAAGQRFPAGRRGGTHSHDGAVTLLSLIRQLSNVPLSTVVARRRALLAAGLFDTCLPGGCDFDMWLRLAVRGERIGYQRVALAERRPRRTGRARDPETELQRAITVLDRFGATHLLDHEARTALSVQLTILREHLTIEEAKRRVREADFAAARSRLAQARTGGLMLGMARLGLWLAPQLVRRVYVALRPSWSAPAADLR